MYEKPWRLPTSKLGDAICLYTVLRHVNPLSSLTFPVKFKSLFTDVRCQSDGAVWHAPARFMETSQAHVIDRLAATYEVDEALIQAPLWTRPTSRGYVALCPHASDVRREWATRHWLTVSEWLFAHHIPFQWFNAPRTGQPALPFDSFAGGIAHARCVVSVDSGQVHLADGFGVPCIGLYGPVHSRHWGGYRSRDLALDGSDLPERKSWGNSTVVDRISPSAVIERLEAALSRSSPSL